MNRWLVLASLPLALLFVSGCGNQPPAGGREEAKGTPPRENRPMEVAGENQAGKLRAQPAEADEPRPKARYEERMAKLLAAAEKGQVSVALEALADGANVNDKDEKGETALMKAAANGHVGLVTELIVKGADTNEKDRKGQTALMRAAEGGNVSILKVLMAGALVAKTGEKAIGAGKELLKGAGVKLPDIKVPGLGDAPLGATELDLQDSSGQTALMKAAAAGQVQSVKLLFQANSQSANLQDNKGQTALTHAILKGSPDCVTTLLGGWLYENAIRDNEGNTPLSHAVVQGNVEICRTILNVTVWGAGNQARGTGKSVFLSMADNQGRTPLMRAIAGGHAEVIQLLLDSFDKEYKKRVECIERKDNSGKSTTQIAEEAGKKEIAGLLKEYTEAFSRDANGLTGLMQATQAGNLKTVTALIGRGADVLAFDDKGQTALMMAAAKGQTELAEALLATFGDNSQQRLDYLNLKDKSGKTAAKVAEEANHKELASLLRDYTDFDLRDDMGLTPLMKASQAGDRQAVARLIAKGADVTAKDNQGMTPLMHAAVKGHASVIPMVGPKADDLRDNQGRTALMHAADNGHLDAARAIVQIVGARNFNFPSTPIREHIALVDKTGKTARQLAEGKKHPDVVQYLSGL